MQDTSQSKLHNTVGGGLGVVGGILLWITTHLGTAFYALLILVFLNVIAAMWEQDLLKSLSKWIKIIMGVAIPFSVPLLAKSQGIGWNDGDTKTLVGLIFAALLSSTVPDLLRFTTKVMNAFHVSPKTQDTTLADLKAEIAALKVSQGNVSINPAQAAAPFVQQAVQDTTSNVVPLTGDNTPPVEGTPKGV